MIEKQCNHCNTFEISHLMRDKITNADFCLCDLCFKTVSTDNPDYDEFLEEIQ
jgi:hypothetical protein